MTGTVEGLALAGSAVVHWESPMTPNVTPNATPEKPEWFELISGDAPSARVAKVNKVIPAMVVAVSGALIATGAFFADASSDQGASTSVSQATSSPTASIDLSPAASALDAPSVTPQGGSQSTQVSPTVKNSTTTPTPPIMLPPTGGDDDEDDDDEDDDDEDDDDEDEDEDDD